MGQENNLDTPKAGIQTTLPFLKGYALGVSPAH